VDDESLRLTRRAALLGTTAFAVAAALPHGAGAASATISTLIDAGDVGAPLSPFLFGGFLEHLRGVITDCFWSELLADRKFYYPVSAEPPVPARASGGPAGAPPRRWQPIGPASAISMDTQSAYVGEHSVAVQTAGPDLRGIAQTGLALITGMTYTGRIVMKADRSTEVDLTLLWGPGAADGQTVRVPASIDWSTVPFAFSARAGTSEGRFGITAAGPGTLRIGAVSLMPADNIAGFRADTVALMREMDCKILRLPGGNFISAYDWKDTIGDPDKRAPTLDPVWNAVQQNDAGLDELLHLCRLVNAEPYWCVNTGFGEPRSGAELVEYVNGPANSPWGAKRVANGYPQPWRVRYWNAGNEMYGAWQFGHMTRDQYNIKHNLFAGAMRKVDPSIYIVAPGGFADEMTTGQGIVIPGQYKVDIGSERDWAYGMFKNCWGKFDALATHAYPPENKRYNYTTGKQFDVKQTLNEWARQPANRVRTMYDCWVDYKQRFPALEQGRVKVFFDEWAYHFQDDLKGSLAIALAFHEFFRHSDFIDMAGYTMATAWLDFDSTRSVVSAKGRIFQLYNRHFGKWPLAVFGNSPVPTPQYPIGGDQPRVNAGSATYPLDVSAALTADRRALVLAIVNATEEHRALDLAFERFRPGHDGRCWKFTGTGLEASNRVNQAPQVRVEEGVFHPARTLSIAPISVELYEFPAAQENES
jgi:alpha-N-arabinofuranosidase